MPMDTSKKRVVVTGIGVVTPCGDDCEKLWDSVITGNSSAEISNSLKDSEIPVKIASELNNFCPNKYFNPKIAMRLDRQGVFAFAAAKMAVDDARLKTEELPMFKTGVFEGTALASLNTNFQRHSLYLKEGLKKIGPLALLNGLAGNASGVIAHHFNIHGPAITFSNACVSSSIAIGYAFRKIQNGDLEIAIAGGAEAPVSKEIIGLFAKANLLSTNNQEPHGACKPFDLNRNGFFIGEGGAFLILEELERALNRKANIYTELKGFGESTDAYHGSSPEPQGKYYASAMEDAFAEAGVMPEQIDYINVHGTATKLNDPAEANGIKAIFNGHSSNVLISSTKQVTGHLLGACGSLELAITCLAVKNNLAPGVKTLQNVDPECNVNIIKEPVKKEINFAMSNNLSFGGRNSSIIISKFIN